MAPTPMRTPRTMQDGLMIEARNQAALNNTQTPLLGGQNAELIDPDSVFAKTINPQFKVPQTPNQIKQMLETQSAQSQLFAVPQSRKRNQQAAQTPIRDQFNLNERSRPDFYDDTSNWENSSSQMTDDTQFIPKTAQEQLKMSLMNIPKSKKEYYVEIPDLEDEEDQERMKQIDAREEEQLRLKQVLQEREKQIRMKSLAIRKKLPRPFQVPNQIYDHIYRREDVNDLRKEAEQMLEFETIQLLTFDMQNFPFAGSKASNIRINIERIEENDILKASELINKEMHQIKEELQLQNVDTEFIYSKQKDSQYQIQFNRLSNQQVNYQTKIFKQNSNKKYQNNRLVDVKKDKEELKEITKQQAERNKLIIVRYQIALIYISIVELLINFILNIQKQKDSKKIDQFLFNKARTTLAGFSNLILKNGKEMDELIQTHFDLSIELDVFKKLQEQEKLSVIYRTEEIKNYHDSLFQKEKQLQEKYDRLDLLRYELTQEQQNGNGDMDVEEEIDGQVRQNGDDDIHITYKSQYSYYNQNVIIEEVN